METIKLLKVKAFYSRLQSIKYIWKKNCFIALLMLFGFFLSVTTGCNKSKAKENKNIIKKSDSIKKKKAISIDTNEYNKRIQVLYNSGAWLKLDVKTPYPLPGALLPFKRVIAFYGNLYSRRMGILGQLPKYQMLKKLEEEVKQWQIADSSTTAIPALHYIAITAQSSPGKNGKYRLRMPFKQIDTIMSWAKSINAIVFLDVQVGQSTVEEEVNSLLKYLKYPNVHLGIDPEFAMKKGEVPGTKIGTLSSEDINKAITILQAIVKENKLPPKILVVHRFTKPMVTDYKKIRLTSEVQIVMNMDGFGTKELKKSSYNMAISKEPVQFTGVKLFYKNDTQGKNRLYTPHELLKFTPKPIYIQYQ